MHSTEGERPDPMPGDLDPGDLLAGEDEEALDLDDIDVDELDPGATIDELGEEDLDGEEPY
jgi:hypothetical protein